MKLKVKEIMSLCLWIEYCQETGTDPWAVDKKELSKEEEVEIPEAMLKVFLRCLSFYGGLKKNKIYLQECEIIVKYSGTEIILKE